MGNSGKPPRGAGNRERVNWQGRQQPSGATAQHQWQQDPRRERLRAVARVNRPRRLKLAAAGLTAVALLGALVYFLLIGAPATPLLAVAFTGYAAPLPPNAWAREDVERFDNFQSPSRSFRHRGAIDPETHTGEDDWFDPERPGDLLKKIDEWLQGVAPGGPKRNAVMIYLSGHGVVDDDGEACLVLPDKGGPSATSRRAPWDTGRWLRVRDLVEKLNEQKPNVKKVIFLDANRIDVQWNMGLLANGFAAALPRALTDAGSVAVINSTSPGEKAWAAPEWRASFFGDSVRRALAGEADGAVDGRRNKNVTFEELAEFVRKDVLGLVNENRHDLQTPMAINGVGRDFDVARVDDPSLADDVGDAPQADASNADAHVQGAGKSNSIMTKQADAWKTLGEMWRIHERWRNSADTSAVAVGEQWLTFQLFEQRLTRWEQELLAGAAYQDAAQKSEAAVRSLAKQLKPSSPASPPAHSLPLEQLWNRPTDQARVADQAFTELLNDDRPPGDQAAGNEPADVKPAGPSAAIAVAPYAVRAAAGWKWLVDGTDRPTVERLRRFRLLVGTPDDGRPPLAESHFVSLLLGEGTSSTNVPLVVWNQNRDNDDVRTALRTRDLAEKAAAPRDERVQYAVQPSIDAADGLRRQADDQLFIGLPEGLADAREKWRQASEAYQAAIELGDELAGCYAARDRAWSQLPHWAQHVDRRWRYSRDAHQVEAVADAIAQTRLLAEALELYQQARQSGEGQPGEALDEARLRREKVVQIIVALDTSATDLLSRAADAQKARDMESLLAGPLVTGEQRARIHQDLLTWLKNRGTTSRGRSRGETETASGNAKQATTATLTSALPSDSANRGPSTNKPAKDGSSMAAPWDTHPALLLLAASDERGGTSVAPSDREDDLAGAGTKVRKSLAKFETVLTGLLARDTPASGDGSAWKARKNLSSADRRVRPAAAIWLWPGLEAQSDPVRQLAQFDRNQFLAWHCDRVLTDFWGPSQAGETPYFAQVFRPYHDAARELPSEASLASRWKHLDDRCQRLLTSLTDKVWPTDNQTTARSGAGGAETSVLLHQAEYPAGTAALLARDAKEQPAAIISKDAGDPAPGERLPVAVSGESGPWPTSGEPLNIVLRAGGAASPGQAKADAKPGPWQLIWLYRGHLRPYQVEAVDPGQGMELVYQPPKASQATIRVRGEAKQPGCVVFVLDCSASMYDNGRMDVAKRDLKEIARLLADNGQYDVGLWFYGHRVGIEGRFLKDGRTPNPNAGKLKPNENWKAYRRWWGEIDDTLVPANDVQRVLAVRRLDRETLADFDLAIDTAAPYGQTPLYHAMISAVQNDLAHQSRELPRRLVVVTDGVNRVSNAGRAPVTADEVRQALQAGSLRGVQLDIVGVELDKNLKSDEKRSFNDLKALADGKTVRYYSADQLADLMETLKKALYLRQYSVTEPDDPAAVDAKQINIGQPVEVRTPSAKKLRISIPGESEAKSDVEVRGDETLELYLDKRGSRLRLVHAPRGTDGEFERYGSERQTNERMAAREVQNPDGRAESPFNPLKLFVAAYRPSRGAGTRMWNFPITVQNAEPERFSPRPAEAWVDVTPIAESGGQTFDTYPVYDVKYEPHLPVPVIDCTLSRWPEEATKAEIRVWLKLKPTPVRQEVQLRDAVNNRVLVEGGKRGRITAEISDATGDDDVAGYDGAVVRVTEQQAREGDLRWLKIELSETPGLVRRTFYHEGTYAVHEFYFPNRTREDVSKAALLITSRDDLERGAAAVSDQPLEVSLPR